MSSAKLPSFQFYPGDWMKDPALRAVSLPARGLWIDLLCLMWESPIRGVLLSDSRRPFSAEHIARMSGCSVEVAGSLIDELKSVGVCSVRKDGSILSRRMVREEEERSKTRQKMQTWRRKSMPVNQNVTKIVTAPLPRCDLTSSSSSSSSVTSPLPPSASPPPGIDLTAVAARIHARHPNRRGQLHEVERALATMLADSVNPDALAESLDSRHAEWCRSQQWQEAGHKFVPLLPRWIREGRCWDEPPAKPSDGYIDIRDLEKAGRA
jgi:hypothetical protein